ncbi:MAG: alpha-ketoglutarate-dependent dioxygenase AlkB [Gammaproteobacteria bacterium]|nr:alpha-ketoglutarate-dependent dioxygenase AlkB [Gammaproteobacteria bacterium]
MKTQRFEHFHVDFDQARVDQIALDERHFSVSGASFRLIPSVILPADLGYLSEQFLTTGTPLHQGWFQNHIHLFGKTINEPRLIQWMSDPGVSYRYSGSLLKPTAWQPEVEEIRQKLEHLCADRFNSVLINLYRNGQDYMGWHSDNEMSLGPTPKIASISLGAVRDFDVRANDRAWQCRFRVPSGWALVMSGQSQMISKHQLPKRTRLVEPRINLTFRNVLC